MAELSLTSLQTEISGKANSSHTHTKAQISDFTHTHDISQITGTITVDVASNLTGFTNSNISNPVTQDGLTNNGIAYVSGISLFGQADGALYAQAYSTSWVHQIYGDYRTGQLAVRGKNSGTWQPWRTVLDSSNYNNYAPTKTGSGASGTWGINITGNAATSTTSTTSYNIPTSDVGGNIWIA